MHVNEIQFLVKCEMSTNFMKDSNLDLDIKEQEIL